MEKFIIAAAVIGATALHINDAVALTAIGGIQTCCKEIYDDRKSCTHYTCNGTEYTDCDTCNNGNIPIKGVSYDPCNTGAVWNVEVGICSGGTIVQLPCTAGKYGAGGIDCTDCPAPGTSNENTQLITGCYIPSGTVTTDATGTLEYTADCHYDDSLDVVLPIRPVS